MKTSITLSVQEKTTLLKYFRTHPQYKKNLLSTEKWFRVFDNETGEVAFSGGTVSSPNEFKCYLLMNLRTQLVSEFDFLKYTEREKLAQVGNIRDAVFTHVTMFGDTETLEGVLSMAVNLAFKGLGYVDTTAIVNIKTFNHKPNTSKS